MDTAQLILIIAVSVLTSILAVVGFEVFLIVREFLKVVRKANKILDDAAAISDSVSKQVHSVTELAGALKTGVDLAKIFFKEKVETKEVRHGGKDHYESLDSSDGHYREESVSPVRRFFTRSGKRLS
ncbi:MAG: hypothetical protein Q8P89_02515 [bacterium]|nr:hypothetical protein [bacterium]